MLKFADSMYVLIHGNNEHTFIFKVTIDTPLYSWYQWTHLHIHGNNGHTCIFMITTDTPAYSW